MTPLLSILLVRYFSLHSVTKEVSLDSEEAKEELAKREAGEGPAEMDKSLTKEKTASSSSTSSRPPNTASSASAAKPAALKTAALSGPSGSGAVEKILSLGKQKGPVASGKPLTVFGDDNMY